jgi:hypothetical protein
VENFWNQSVEYGASKDNFGSLYILPSLKWFRKLNRDGGSFFDDFDNCNSFILESF